MTFVLLEILPMEAMGDNDPDGWTGVNVIAVNESEAELIVFLAAYTESHLAACKEWDVWDAEHKGDWGPEHDKKFDELCEKYGVASLIDTSQFRIQTSRIA
jgi:hypothetical protein